ncbi:MAG: hypothetical protein ACJAUD_000913 [Crocinitomicaceae bacterium]|jgi:hypothetical protein
MIYRYVFIAFIGSISLFLISAGTSVTSSKVETYKPLPPRSGGAGANGLGDRTGSPLSAATCAQCHGGGSFGASISMQLLDGAVPVTSYTAGTNYTVVYTVTGSSSAFGFQGGALTSTNTSGGAFSSPSAGTQLVTISGRPYIEHIGASATGTFQSTWTAPVANSGSISFYGIGLAANGNGVTSGDEVTAPAVMTITETLPTTITFPGNPFCADEANQTPSLVGITSGVYSAGAGLTIDPSTGEVNISTSTPGTYPIAYTHSNGVANTSVTIFPTFTSTSAIAICDNETLTFGSQTLDASNAGLNTEIFQSIDGCDSTVNLTLTVLPTIVESDAASICFEGTYDFNGQTLTAANAGLNTLVLQSANGCDSTVNLTLTVLPAVIETDAATICPSETYDFNGQTLTAANAGLNTVVLQGANGCDSTVNLTLTVEAIDITTTLTSGTLTANQTGATYQWVDCDNGNAAIAGETNATYSPSALTGNYAVEITVNNCTETSACTLVDFTSLEELNINSSVVFPNPVSDLFEIKNIEQFGTIKSISLMDTKGKVVKEISVNATSTNIGNLDSGIYFLRIESESGDSIITVVKK